MESEPLKLLCTTIWFEGRALCHPEASLVMLSKDRKFDFFFFVTSPPFPFHVPALGRCPTGLATNESGTRRTSANFKRRPISMLQKQPWQLHMRWLQPCRTTRPTHPPRRTLVSVTRSLSQTGFCHCAHPIDWSRSLTEHTVELKGRLVFTCGDVLCGVHCSQWIPPVPGRFWNLYT